MSNHRVMFEGLSAPDRRPLARPPLHQVTFSLNFRLGDGFGPRAGVDWLKALHARGIVKGEGALRESALQSIAFDANTMAVQPTAPPSRGWQVADSGATYAIYPDAFVFEEKSYPGWERYAQRLHSILEALQSVLDPELRSRLGLRFFNFFRESKARTPSYWAKKLREPFLTFAAFPPFADRIEGGASMVTFRRDSLECQVRTGFLFAGDGEARRSIISLDIDTHDGQIVPMDYDDVMGDAMSLGLMALTVFQQVVEPKYLERLRNG